MCVHHAPTRGLRPTLCLARTRSPSLSRPIPSLPLLLTLAHSICTHARKHTHTHTHKRTHARTSWHNTRAHTRARAHAHTPHTHMLQVVMFSFYCTKLHKDADNGVEDGPCARAMSSPALGCHQFTPVVPIAIITPHGTGYAMHAPHHITSHDAGCAMHAPHHMTPHDAGCAMRMHHTIQHSCRLVTDWYNFPKNIDPLNLHSHNYPY